MKSFLTAALFTAIVAATPFTANAASYEFDTAHTQIMFKVNHLGFSNSHGRFMKFDGTLDFDAADVAKSKLDVTIDTASIDMGDQKWDDHLKNADFFDVEKFPSMTFKSTKVEKTGEKTGKVTGDLTILGVTKPVTLDVVMNKMGKHPMSGKEHVGFSATGTLKRSDFGMNYGLPNVGDTVTLMIEAEASAKDASAPAAE